MDDTAMNPDPRTRELRAEIAQTREEMAETIEAIEDRLRPGTIVANATERVKAATNEKVRAMADSATDTAAAVIDRTKSGASGLFDTLRDNPYPTALIGLGAAWLFMSARGRQDSGYSRGTMRGRYDRYGRYQNEPEGMTARASEYASETGEAIRRSGRQVQNRVQQMMSENPLLVGAGALMIGAALGLAVPETEPENQWMGDMRDSMVDRAQQMASEAATKVQDTANQIADAASNVVQSVSGSQNPA